MPIQIILFIWFGLFVGRGIGGMLLLWSGLVAPETLRAFDDGTLTPLYEVLLVTTLVTYYLRSRGGENRVAETSNSAMGLETETKSVSAREEKL